MSDSDDIEGLAPLRDGGSLAYALHGRAHAGLPVLLIRPLGGTMALWGAFRAELAKRLRVIAFDLRGTGGSSADPAWVRTAQIAEDAVDLLDHLAVPRAHVFGISLGGMAATMLAIRAPERVARLCIACAPASGVALMHAELRQKLELAGSLVTRADEREAALVHEVLSPEFRAAQPDAVARIEDVVRRTHASTAALAKHAMAGLFHDARAELGGIRSPTLVLAGERDTLLGTDAPRALAEGIPGARFEVIAEAGHDLTLERPVETAARVTSFLVEAGAGR